MIAAGDFLEAAGGYGIATYAGVPCSYLTPFINRVISDDGLDYIASANEGDAVATAAGAWVATGRIAVAMMQNSGLGNAVSPLTSLCYTFRIPALLIVTLRGDPRFKDEPQHALMGRITTDLLDTMGITWNGFPDDAAGLDTALEKAMAHMRDEHLPYALVMHKGSVAAEMLRAGADFASPRAEVRRGESGRGERPSRAQALTAVLANTRVTHDIVIATTGYTGRELFALDDRPNHLYMVGSMGCASSFALGLARNLHDRRIVVVDGDGAALMRMGNLATLGTYAPDNLIHILLDNAAHESTGGQITVSPGVDFPAVAAACGYRDSIELNSASELGELLAGNPRGPVFGRLRTRIGVPENLPRPTIGPVAVKQRLMRHIGNAA